MDERFHLVLGNLWRGLCLGIIIGLGIAAYLTEPSVQFATVLRFAFPSLVFLALIPTLLQQMRRGVARYRQSRDSNKVDGTP